jgi:DmsE family decaheme c-type cytochrome
MLWIALLILAASAAQAQPPAGTGYVGNEVCRKCHSDVWLNFPKNPHFRSIAAGNLPPESTGCEGCHGPGAAHVEKPSKSTIRAFSQMAPKQVLDNCLTCHGKDLSRANIRRSSHTLADVTCSSCHSIHRSPTPKFLLAKQQANLCYTCHQNVRAQFDMPFKHRVNEGVMQCSDCHNPHGAFAPTWRSGLRPRMQDQHAGEQSCVRCHTDKRGPFVFEHPPVRIEGCESCHVPHGSMNTRMLTRPVVFTLCLECHNGAGTFGRQGDGIKIQTPSHNMLDPKFRTCTTCHFRIHGSNAAPNFLR